MKFPSLALIISPSKHRILNASIYIRAKAKYIHSIDLPTVHTLIYLVLVLQPSLFLSINCSLDLSLSLSIFSAESRWFEKLLYSFGNGRNQLIFNVTVVLSRCCQKNTEERVKMAVEYRCCGSEFFIHILIIVLLVMFAGMMSGLTLGLMSMSLVDLEVLAKSGTPRDRLHAGTDS